MMRGSMLILLCGTLLLACSSDRAARARPVPRSQVAVIPGPDLDRERRWNIRSLDLRSGAADELYLVWKAFSGTGLPGKIWYQSSADGGRTWRAPVSVTDCDNSARVVPAGRRLHVITGTFLAHFVSEDGGAHWDSLGLIAGDYDNTLNCDATSVGDTLLVAYIYSSGESKERNQMQLDVVTWVPGGAVTRRRLLTTTLSPHFDPGPRFVKAQGKVHLLCEVLRRDERRRQLPQGVAIESHLAAQMFHWETADGGITWSSGTKIPLQPGKATKELREDWLPGYRIPSYAFALTARREFAFYGPGPLIGLEHPTGASWSEPKWLTQHQVEEPDGPVNTTVSAAGSDRTLGVAWIGKLPSKTLDPLDWILPRDDDITNDVFALLVEGNPSLATLASAAPLRLTTQGGRAECVGVCLLPDALVCVWSGRAKLELTHAAETPPQLFCTRIAR